MNDPIEFAGAKEMLKSVQW